MTFDPSQYKTTTRQQWQGYDGAGNAWGPPNAAEYGRLDRASFGALHQMHAGLDAEQQELVSKEIEGALGVYETSDGFVGPCELVIAGATR